MFATSLFVQSLATHHSFEEIYVDSHEITSITSETVHIRVSGSIGVPLQWGSNSDLRRGDGAELDESSDYTCELTREAANPNPEALNFVEDSLMVDTGGWLDHEEDWIDSAASTSRRL